MTTSTSVPELRVQDLNGAPLRGDRSYVLYWMTANRRLDANFALQHAVDAARRLGKPLAILEALRAGYRWASDRIHRFVIDGMADHEARLAGTSVLYHPYVEPEEGAGKGLLAAMAEHAALVVTDDWPCFFLPRMQEAAAGELDVRLEMVDANGLLPMRASAKLHETAHGFRAELQKKLPAHLQEMPKTHPLRGGLPKRHRLPAGIAERWPAADLPALRRAGGLAGLPIDHGVGAVGARGGAQAAKEVLERFVGERLGRYAEQADEPEAEATSGLSPYLHFGHIGAHQVLRAVADHEGWAIEDLGRPQGGKRPGWWGMSEPAEAFMDQLVTWRELGFNMCWQRDDYDRWESLPGWARRTLGEHATDERPTIYDAEVLAAGGTGDEVWNAAQGQLLIEGRIHNYLRMLWGKNVLEWTEHPEDALEIVLDLNNRYALDGRDPNSTSGVFWCFGRYDRPWGPERPIYGKVRYMTSRSTRRKHRIESYIERYAPS